MNLKSGKVKTIPVIKKKFKNKSSPEQPQQPMRQLLPWAERTRHRDMTAMLMVCCSSVGFFHGFSQFADREGACVKNEAVNVKACSALVSVLISSVLREWEYFAIGLAAPEPNPTDMRWHCCHPRLVDTMVGAKQLSLGSPASTSPWSQSTCGSGGKAPAPSRALPWPQHS